MREPEGDTATGLLAGSPATLDAMRIRRSRRRRGALPVTGDRRPPEPPPSEQVAEAQGARSPGVRQRRSPQQPRQRDWNTRLRESLRGGSGETTWRT